MASSAHSSPDPAFTGSCYCGTTRYSSASMPTELTHCHCNPCRKLHGGPFVTYADIAANDLTWLNRTELQEIQTSPMAMRGFCRLCGSMMFMQYDWEADRIGIGAGTIDEGSHKQEMPRPEAHIFTECKASWYEITDGLKQFKRHTPDSQKKLDDWEHDKPSKE